MFAASGAVSAPLQEPRRFGFALTVLVGLAVASAVWAEPMAPVQFADEPPASNSEPAASSAADLLAAALERSSSTGPALGTHRLRGLRPEVVGALFSPDELDDFPIEVLAPAVPAEGDASRSGVALLIEIDGADFLNRNQAETARVEVYAYALGEDKRVVAHLAEMFTVDVASRGEAIWQSGLKFHGGLELPPGRYELIVLVRNYQSGAKSRQRLAVEVPAAPLAAQAPAPGVNPAGARPVVGFAPPSSRDAWLPVESAGYERFWSFDRNRGVPSSPAARAVLVSGHEVEAFALGVFDESPGGQAESAGRVEFRNEAGNEPTATVEARIQQAARGTSHRLHFEVPELVPGRYQLRWAPLTADSVPAAGSSPQPSAWVPVAVVGAETRERELLWSDLRWMLQERPDGLGETGVAPAPGTGRDLAVEGRRGGRAVRRLASRYRVALGELGSATPRRARAAVFELESEVLGQGDRKAQLTLRTAETSVAKEVAARDPQALVPLLLLHSELVEQYRSRRIFSLVTHSRIMVEIIAELLAESGGSTSLAASVLAIQGRYLQQVNLVAGSRRLLTRALEHDPQSAAALLGLAASFEKYAEYNRAIELLSRLVAVRPDLDEAALRLAINQARVGWLPRARVGLERLIAEDGNGWVSALAAEELARTYLIGADLGRAASILEPALERMPHWPGLRLLLAHVYDRQGRIASALELVAEVEVNPDTGASARRRYDEWPRQLVAGALEELEREARNATPILLAGLAAGEEAR